MYNVHLGLIGKRVVDLLLVIIELFSVDVTAEVLRPKIDRESAISLHRGQFYPKFQVEWDVPTNNFYMANECPTTLPLTVFTQIYGTHYLTILSLHQRSFFLNRLKPLNFCL